MFFFFWILVLLPSSESTQVPQCNQLHFDLNTTESSTNTVLYRLSFDVDVQKSPNEFYNDVILRNFIRWSLNESVYYEYYPLYFFVQGMERDVYCNATDGICRILNMRDGFGTISFSLALGDEIEYSEYFMNYFYINGTVYNSWGGRMFDPQKDPCFEEKIDLGDVLFKGNVCCSNYFYISVPDTVDSFCEEFTGETNFFKDNNTVAHFKAVYVVTNTTIAAVVAEYTGPNGTDVDYYFQPNSDIYISGCYGNIPGCAVKAEIDLPDHDHSFNFVLDVWDLPYWDYNAINGQLVSRNGVWVKEGNVPYTPSDPCWTRVVDSNNGTTSSTSFCCKKWVPINHSTCAEYRTKTIVNINSAPADVLNARYILNSNNTMTVQIVNYTTPSNNINQKVQLESFASTGEDQLCSSNATFWNTCLFNEYGNDNYTLIMRTSDFPDGWNMVVIGLQGQQLVSPSISVQNPCHTETHDYNGLNPSTTAQTEICCIASPNGPWPGST